MVHLKNLKQYYFIDKFDYSHLINLDKDISLIWRNKNKETQLKDLKKLRNFCKKYQKKIFVRNDIKLALKISADGLYISSRNKDLIIKPFTNKKNFEIIGSAHNLREIKIKERQGVSKIFLSPIFKKKGNNQLGIFRYLSLRKLSPMKDIALGGINNKNIKKFNLIKPFGFAGISYFS